MKSAINQCRVLRRKIPMSCKLSSICAVFVFALILFMKTSVAWAQEARSLQAGQQVFQSAADDAYLFAFSCLANERECGLQGQESRLLNSIYNELLFAPSEPLLEFKSGATDPSFFLVDGAVRLARTGSARGGKISVNSDFFASVKDEMGIFPFAGALASVIHELGHHNTSALPAPVSHETLDALGLKVAEQMQRYRREKTWQFENADGKKNAASEVRIAVVSILGSPGQRQNQSRLQITDAGGFRTESGSLLKNVTCPRSFFRGELDFEGSPIGFHFDDFTFVNARSLGAIAEVEINVAGATVLCKNNLPGKEETVDFFNGYRNGKLIVRFNAVPIADTLGNGFVFSEVKFEIQTPPDQQWN